MADPESMAIFSAAGGVVGEAGSVYEQYQGEKSEEDALELQSKEIALITTQKTIANYDLISKTIKAQRAAVSVRGVDMSSPSFDAIQADTLNKGAAAQKNINTEAEISQLNLRTEESNVRNKLYGELFGDITQTSAQLGRLSMAAPSQASDAIPNMFSVSENVNNEDSEDEDEDNDGE